MEAVKVSCDPEKSNVLKMEATEAIDAFTHTVSIPKPPLGRSCRERS